jgi:hypothetical protein
MRWWRFRCRLPLGGLRVDVDVGGVLGIAETPSAPVSTVALVLKRPGHDVAEEAPRAVLRQQPQQHCRRWRRRV